MLNEIVIKQLAFIKYLYHLAVRQSQGPEPMCSAAILMFHDAIELFLHLASEYHGVGKSGIEFMQYWDVLSNKLGEGIPTQKESMRGLSKARGGLKHHGTLPSKLNIEACRANATTFFEENTPHIFDVEFAEISLIDLVECDETKNNLKSAQQLLMENKIEESVKKVAIAFKELIDDYEDRKRGFFGQSAFDILPLLTFSGYQLSSGKGQSKDFADFVDKVRESLEVLQDAVKMIGLGINYRKYIKFRLLTPGVHKFGSGKYSMYGHPRSMTDTPSADNIQFCIDFVIESSITLTEFDFDIERHKRFLEKIL